MVTRIWPLLEPAAAAQVGRPGSCTNVPTLILPWDVCGSPAVSSLTAAHVWLWLDEGGVTGRPQLEAWP